jgi:hypothetical protein
MSSSTLDRMRLPAAAFLVVVVAFVLWPRAGDAQPATSPSATPVVIVGEPGGGVLPPSAPPPTLTPAPTPSPSPMPDTFSAEVFACRSIDEAKCEDEVSRLRRSRGTITALVLFSDARAGDAIDVTLSGEGVSLAGGPFVLDGGGDGYYHATFRIGDLGRGEYTLTAMRNGAAVATTTFRIGGDEDD